VSNQAKTKQRVQLTSDEIGLLQTLVLDDINWRVQTGQPVLLGAVLLVKLGKAKNRCAIMEPGGEHSGGKKEAPQAG